MNSFKEQLNMVTDYFPELWRKLPWDASIADACRMQLNQGNAVFFDAQKNILKELFRESYFSNERIRFHDMIHIVGEFSHTPYGEEFVVTAENCGKLERHPLKISVMTSRFFAIEYIHERSTKYSEDIYQKTDYASQREIKDWEMIYAGAVGYWFFHKVQDYMNAATSHPDPRCFSAPDKKTGVELALKMQSESLEKKAAICPTAEMIEKRAEELPAALLRLSQAEKRLLLSLARSGLKNYHENNGVLNLPAKLEPLRPRIENTMRFMDFIVYSAPHLERHQRDLAFKEARLNSLKNIQRRAEKADEEAPAHRFS